MQIIVFLSIVLISGYVGVQFAKKYIKKENFYIDLLSFCNVTFTEINFTQNKLKKIINQNINNYKTEFKKFLNIFSKHLDDEINDEVFMQTVKRQFDFLLEQEIVQIVTFFVNIGRVDVDNELNKLDIFKADIKRILDNTSQKKKQYVPMVIKLSLLLGVGIGILIL